MGIAKSLLFLLFLPVTALAQGADIARSIQLGFDNDLFSVRGPGKAPDYDYSSGMRASVFHASAPAWLRRTMKRDGRCDAAQDREAGCIATGFGVTHQIYTPRENSAEPVPGQRPYAGWLYGSLDMTLVRGGWSRSLGIDAGVTGPLSFAEQMQNRLHDLLHNKPQLGWKNQLGNAPGVVLRYDEGHRAERTFGRGIAAVDVYWGAAAGNIVNTVSAGTDVTIGLRGALPWSPAEPRVARPARTYLTFGYRQDAVLHSVLIEGRGTGPGATRRPLVGQLEAGVGFRHRLFGAAFRHVVRTREYDAQPSQHAHGSLTLTAVW